MKAKKVQSDFDFKKWGLFLVFLIGLGITVALLLKPEGESKARVELDRARSMNRKARETAARTNTPQDLAQVDESTLALNKANAAFIESEFATASAEALKSISFSEKVVSRDAVLVTGSIRIGEQVGEVQVRKKGNNGFEKVNDKISLGLGDELQTSSLSSCLLVLQEGTEIWVLPSTLIVLQEDPEDIGAISLFLESGAVNIRTLGAGESNRFHLRSAAGTARVWRESDALAETAEEGKSLRLRVREGRADAYSDKRTIPVGTNQAFMFSEALLEGEAHALLAPPRLVSPVRSSKFDANANGFAAVKITWEPAQGASTYHVQLASDPLFVSLSDEKSNYSGTSLQFPALKAGSYYWRVATLSSKGESGLFSSPLTFEVQADKGETQIGGGLPPMLEIKNTIVQGNMVIVEGTTSRDASVKLNGEVALVNKESGQFSHVVRLNTSGVHKVNIVAESTSGSIAFKNISVSIKE